MTSLLHVFLAALCICGLPYSRALAASPPTITTIIRGFTVPYSANMPEQITLDRYNNVYSLDFENNQLAMFDYNGTFLHSFTTDDPAFKGPTGVAVDMQLSVYVADQNNERIVKFHANGSVAQVYGGRMYNGVAVDRKGFIYTFVYGEAAVLRMDQNGTVLQRYNSTTYSNRGGLAIDCDGNLLVADMGNARAVRVNTQTGDVLNEWTTTKPALNYPWNIAGDCASKDVLIADAFNGRVVRMDNNNNVVAIYQNHTGYGVAFTPNGDVLVAPGGQYNVAVMATAEQARPVVEAAIE